MGSGEVIRVINPSTGEVCKEVPVHTEGQVEEALARACACRVDPEERFRILTRVHAALADRAMDAARIVVAEQGKPLVEALVAEVLIALDHLHWAIRNAKRLSQFEPMASAQILFSAKRQRLGYLPRGTTLLICPWNYPFGLPFIQTVQAVAAGNTVLLKCASATPVSAGLIEELFRDAGAPGGLVQRLVMPGERVTPLLRDPRVKVVVFTGSTEVGRRVGAVCAERIKPCILELGGKDPAVVLKDADLDIAVEGILWGGLMNTGQTCASIERIYVERPLYETFVVRLAQACRRLKVGNPLESGTDLGPMTLSEQRAWVDERVREAKQAGAEIVCGGVIPDAPGFFYPPTILTGVTHEMSVMREESFGPLLPVMPFSTLDEAVRLANDNPYGLTASIWTRSKALAHALAPRLEAGAVTVNDHVNTFAEPGAPWHGVKDSGLGATHGAMGLKALGEMRFQSFDFASAPRAWWFPYDEAGLEFFTTALTGLHGRGWARGRALLGLMGSSQFWKRTPWPRILMKPWKLL